MNLQFDDIGTPTDGEAFQPFDVVEGDPACGLLLICDHARNLFPSEYGTLGIDEAQLERHIAYDIGVDGVTRALAKMLGAPAVLSRFSRLLIDPNRGEDDPTLIMQLSDGAVIPGNYPITAQERENRLDRYYRPYHQAVEKAIDAGCEAGKPPALFSIHSFTPSWKGNDRIWHVGVLWDQDPRFALPLIETLSREHDLVVGDNEPYSGALAGDCMYKHGTKRGLAHALIEIRQDLICDHVGIEEWANRLKPQLEEILKIDGINDIRHYGSKSEAKDHG